MNRREKLQFIVNHEGKCVDDMGFECSARECPMYKECRATASIDLETAKRLLTEMNEWQPLEVDNLPPDILTGDYELEYTAKDNCDDIQADYEESGWISEPDTKELISDLCDNNELDFRYRLRKSSPPTVEELAEAYAHDVYENAPPAFDFQRYIKQAYIDGYKSMEVADDK